MSSERESAESSSESDTRPAPPAVTGDAGDGKTGGGGAVIVICSVYGRGTSGGCVADRFVSLPSKLRPTLELGQPPRRGHGLRAPAAAGGVLRRAACCRRSHRGQRSERVDGRRTKARAAA